MWSLTLSFCSSVRRRIISSGPTKTLEPILQPDLRKVVVTAHWVTPRGHFPVWFRLKTPGGLSKHQLALWLIKKCRRFGVFSDGGVRCVVCCGHPD